jgi:hypothetical protein
LGLSEEGDGGSQWRDKVLSLFVETLSCAKSERFTQCVGDALSASRTVYTGDGVLRIGTLQMEGIVLGLLQENASVR